MFDGVSFKPLLTGGEKSKSLYRILVESYRRVVMTERERTTGTFDGLSRILPTTPKKRIQLNGNINQGYRRKRVSLTLPHLALDTEKGFGAVFGGADKSKPLPQAQKTTVFLMFLGFL